MVSGPIGHGRIMGNALQRPSAGSSCAGYAGERFRADKTDPVATAVVGAPLMNVVELQYRLRHLAAERDWQPSHTPKNLATALIVKAAELAEIFQWLTPEDSQQVHENADLKSRIGQELADVLLYLLQLADHTRVDLEHAVAEKLERNARKYPPARTIEVEPPAARRPIETHVLLDYENVQPTDDELRELVPGVSDVWVFHGPHQKRVDSYFVSFGNNVTAVPISKTGKNALDFHLSYYMGYITSRNPDARFVVVANDKGYDPLLAHAKELGFAVDKRGHGRKVAAEKAPAKKALTKHTAAKKPTPVKKAKAKLATPVLPPATQAIARPQNASVTATPTKKAKVIGASGASVMPTKIVDSLRKMGNKRPAKLVSLRKTVKMLLGAGASDEAVDSLIDGLLAKGTAEIEANGAMRYRL
jgi:NTP pyrophosphatase (non-canonical NTP hydrolase)